MRLSVSTSIAKGFDVFLRKLGKFGFDSIELLPGHINDDNLGLLEYFSKKISVCGLGGELKNYNYTLYLGQSLNADFICVELSSRSELKKLGDMVKKAEELGQRVAVVNNPAEVGYPSKVAEMKHIADTTGAHVVLDTAHARTESNSLINFVKALEERIVGIRISDFFRGYGHLPIGIGETEYLDPIIDVFGRSSVPFILTLDERFSLLDAWISRTNLETRYKRTPKR